MADSDDIKRSFPYMGPSTWNAICIKLRQRIPRKMDPDWLMSTLGGSKKAATNLRPQLRALGVIDDDDSPTELALDLRDESSYANAVRKAVGGLYPDSLHDAFPEPSSADSEGLRSWFMRNARTGQQTATYQARFYLALTAAEFPSEEGIAGSVIRRQRGANAAPPKQKPQVQRGSSTSPSSKTKFEPVENEAAPQATRHHPALHIDLQIHIASDAGRDQIEAVFESMAKHLYGRMDE